LRGRGKWARLRFETTVQEERRSSVSYAEYNRRNSYINSSYMKNSYRSLKEEGCTANKRRREWARRRRRAWEERRRGPSNGRRSSCHLCHGSR